MPMYCDMLYKLLCSVRFYQQNVFATLTNILKIQSDMQNQKDWFRKQPEWKKPLGRPRCWWENDM